MLWLYLQDMTFEGNVNVLHLSPEKGIYDRLRERLPKDRYVLADIDPARYRFVDGCVRLDLCNLDSEPSHQFDVIINCHVLEHIPCNVAYPLFHLHRMLKDSGTHVCMVPFMDGEYDECFQDMDEAERERRFGHKNHLRRFGTKDLSSHLGKLLELPPHFDARCRFSEGVLREANIPEHFWEGFNPATVMSLKRDDMKFLGRSESG
jgi:phosphoglycolate phosphatase